MKFIRLLLFPFAIMYAIITSMRNFLFDVGLLKSTSFNKPIIVVGNLSVGGTGKTPQIEYLIRVLKQHKLAVLSRGYGRETKGFVLADRSKKATDIGDEPLQFFRKFKDIIVAVDEDRVHGISQLNAANVLLLDDAFQHRKVTAGFYVVLTKYNALFSNDFVLPAGNLRERRVGIKRANAVVITKCPNTITTEDQNETEKLIRRYFDGPIFFSTITYADVLLNTKKEEIRTSEIGDYEVLLVTGIANPTPMLEYLTGLNCRYTHVNFPDHHQFTEKEINALQHQFDALKSSTKIIVTTEKDFVRLSDIVPNVYYLAIETSFINGQKEFDSLIVNYVSSAL
ncbi:MAG: tetraacyldisaccharide 4'-kinase [Flavobacteriaceae bacterium]|nr:tetraacyldisaccharide 4'-kinase [Flavobacteriaceae bacterium]